MIKTIYKKLQEYLKGQEDIALEIRMHPSVLGDCIDCEYQEVITAFNITPQRPTPTKMFNYRLVVDFDFDENEWRIQCPRI
ncbi:MAG: hypothetical protein JKY50_00315 [Oleispira sp.]|nr:hypothetical protein [Oleispira sp.]